MSYTALLRDRGAGLVAAVSASRSLAVGNAVVAIDPAVGAVASQAWTNRLLRHELLEAMAGGASAESAIARIADWDDEPQLRQAAALAFDGPPAAFTGARNTPWAGELVLADAVLIGNLLTGGEVLDAMAAVLRDDPPAREGAASGADAGSAVAARLARRAVAALAAGDLAGGDRRGRQSAALLLGRRQTQRRYPPELLFDLRVDDDDDPVGRLAVLVERRIDDLAHREDPVSVRRE